ncbi:MAG: hypothetical protein ABSF32_08240 [Ignavibacteria bacterium]|jgi:hypothetical protein
MNDFIEIDTSKQKCIIRKSSIVYIDMIKYKTKAVWIIEIKIAELSKPLAFAFASLDKATEEYERLKKLLT